MKKKIVFLVILIILLLAGGIVYAYFATDWFKTDKELFFSCMLEEKKAPDLNMKALMEYYKKQETTIYGSNGEITFDISGLDEGNTMNESKITFEGKTDNVKNAFEQEVTLDLPEDYTIPIKLKRDGDTFGIQSDTLGESRYLAIRNDNLKELAQRFGMDSEYVPDKIENMTFTPEELVKLGNTYYQFFDEKLTDDMFSKEKEQNQTVVKLNMSAQKFSEIFLEFLKMLDEDKIIQNKLPEAYKEILKEVIKNYEENMQLEDNSEDARFEMKIYIEKGKVKKLDTLLFETNDNYMNIVGEYSDNGFSFKWYKQNILLFEQTLTSTVEDNDVIYDISCEMYEGEKENEEAIIEINAEFKYGNIISQLDNVEEALNLEIKQKSTMNYLNDYDNDNNASEESTMNIRYTNQKTFLQNLELESLDESNAIIINDVTDEELQNVLYSIYETLGLI